MFIEAIIDNGRIKTAAKRDTNDAKKRKLMPSDFKRIGTAIEQTMRFIGEDYEGLSCRIVLRYAPTSKYAGSFLDQKFTTLGKD